MHEMKSSHRPALLIACSAVAMAVLTKLAIKRLAAKRRARIIHLAEGNGTGVNG